jgi:hypothetical protein
LLKDKVGALIKETRQACLGQPPAQAVEEALGCFVRLMKNFVRRPRREVE